MSQAFCNVIVVRFTCWFNMHDCLILVKSTQRSPACTEKQTRCIFIHYQASSKLLYQGICSVDKTFSTCKQQLIKENCQFNLYYHLRKKTRILALTDCFIKE